MNEWKKEIKKVQEAFPHVTDEAITAVFQKVEHDAEVKYGFSSKDVAERLESGKTRVHAYTQSEFIEEHVSENATLMMTIEYGFLEPHELAAFIKEEVLPRYDAYATDDLGVIVHVEYSRQLVGA